MPPLPYVVRDKTFKPGDRVVVCSTDDMANSALAWGITSAGDTGTVIGWDDIWWCWRVAMDDDGEARWPSTYLKPQITSIDDVEKYLAAS